MKKILVVEDNMKIRECMVEIIDVSFARSCLTIISAEDGGEGLVLLVREKIDILITDLSMPNMDGVEMIEKAKLKVWANACPLVIVYSGEDEDYLKKIKKHIEELGIERVFVFEKPFSKESLKDFLDLLKENLK